MKKEDDRLYLSMQILTDYMDDQFSDYYFYRGNDPMILEDVRVYYGQAEISERFVYIVKPSYVQKAMENNCNMILIGKMELPEFAEYPRIRQQTVSPESMKRYSGTQDSHMTLRGIIGKVSFDSMPEECLDYLIAGELIHIGRNTSFGFGKYILRREKHGK